MAFSQEVTVSGHIRIHEVDFRQAQLPEGVTEVSLFSAIRQAYREEMRRDKNVFFMGEDVGRWGSLYRSSKGLLEEFGPDQIKDAPISEAAIAGCGGGAAVMGMRPIVEIMYIDFITIAMDQIVNHAAKWHQLSNGKVKLPIVFKTQGGAGRRNASQHSHVSGELVCECSRVDHRDAVHPL